MVVVVVDYGPIRQHNTSTLFLQVCVVSYKAGLSWLVQTNSHWAYISQLIPYLPFFDRKSAFVTPLPSFSPRVFKAISWTFCPGLPRSLHMPCQWTA